MVLRNPSVEYNMEAFSELSFAVCWQGGERPMEGQLGLGELSVILWVSAL